MRMRLESPCACASDTDGSRSEETDPVKALGNIMSGIAIPEKTPYMDKASDEDRPLATSILGS